MATRIRLSRRGRKRYARYDIVVADSRSPRDGKFIEKLGVYNPNAVKVTEAVVLNDEKAFDWVMKGAVPSETAKKLLSERGIMLRKHLQLGVLKGAVKQEDADKKFQAWKTEKDQKTLSTEELAAKKQEEERKARLAAETKVNEARKAAIASKSAEALAAAAPPAAEEEAAPAEEAPATEAPAAEAEAPKAEAPKEEEKGKE